MQTVNVKPKSQTLSAWQFLGQPAYQWPSWVRESCMMCKAGQLALVHERKSGKQFLYLTEWLVKDLDSIEACFYTNAEFQYKFDVI